MEVSALQHTGAQGAHGRTPLLRLQSDERLVAIVRRGNHHAFEALVARYQSRLLAFCRHMLASREDAEDVLQEVFAAAFNAMLADDRPINVRPWLYRIARNRSLNHLRKQTAIGVDSMDIMLSEHGQSTADRVHKREEFRQLLADVQELPETQRTALLLREIDALSYDQIAEVMETTVPSVKSLLVRARVSLAEAAEARLLTCEEVRDELGLVAEGLARTSPPVRRHLRTCERCAGFRRQLKTTNKALAAVFPVGPYILIKKLVLAHLGSASAAGGGGAAAAGGTAAGAGAAGAAGAAAGSIFSAGASAIATKAAAGLAAAAIVTAGAVEVKHGVGDQHRSGAKRNQPEQVAQVSTPAATPPLAVTQKPQPVTPARPAATAVHKKVVKKTELHARIEKRGPKATLPAATTTPTSTPVPVETATPIATGTPVLTATPSPTVTATTSPTPSATPTGTQHDGDLTTLPTVTGDQPTSTPSTTAPAPNSTQTPRHPPAIATPAAPAPTTTP